MTKQDLIRELATKGIVSLVRDMFIKTPKDGQALSPELYAEMMDNAKKLQVFLEISQDIDIDDTPSTDYIECGGIKWLNQADTKVLYKWDDADAASLVLPTKEELEQFIERTCYSFDKERKVGMFVDRETGVKLELPANGYHDHTKGLLYGTGTRGYYWSSTQYNTNSANYLHFGENGCAIGGCNKQDGHSVCCVRR